MIRLRTLGAVDLRHESADEPIPLPPKQLALLAFLAADPAGIYRRDRLLVIFWPEFSLPRARSALNQALYRLRGTLGRDAVLSQGKEGVGLTRKRVWCDAIAFTEERAEGRLAAALDLYRGPFLDGFHLTGAPDFEHWLDGRRATLRRDAVAAGTELTRRAQEEGDRAAAVRWLCRLREIVPGDEAVTRQLMALLQRSGDRAGALRVYGELESHLREELEIEPSPVTRQVAHELMTTPDPRKSVAILPFREVGSSVVQRGLGSVLFEEVIRAMAQLGSVRVVGGESAARAAQEGSSLARMAEELRVETVVEGTVRESSDGLVVAVRLVSARGGTILWTERYEPADAAADIPAAGEEIARRVAAALQVDVRQGRLLRRPWSEPRAYALYLEGRHAWRRRSPVALGRALRLFEGALELDPGSALAWSGVADTYALLPLYTDLGLHRGYERSREAAARALELDPTLAEARTSLGRVYVHEHRWEAAEAELRQALAAHPNYAPALHWLADHLMRTGRPREALEKADALARLEPLSPVAHSGRAFLYYLAGDWEEARNAAERSLSLGDSLAATCILAFALADGGQPESARGVAEDARRRWRNGPSARGTLGYALLRSGERERALAIARGLADEPAETFYGGLVFAATGAADEAFAMLRGARWTSNEVDFFVSGAPFDPVRGDARYRATLARLGFSPKTEELDSARAASS